MNLTRIFTLSFFFLMTIANLLMMAGGAKIIEGNTSTGILLILWIVSFMALFARTSPKTPPHHQHHHHGHGPPPLR